MQINYAGAGNYSTLAYDALDRCTSIIEYHASSVVTVKQFVWCGDSRTETRDAAGTLTDLYFSYGQADSVSSSYYTKDQLGSIRELTDGFGSLQAQYNYDPFGRIDYLGSRVADFQYAGYYFHQPSGLSLTVRRSYSSGLGRWISRDPLELIGGLNVYSYVGNNPTIYRDAEGLALDYVGIPTIPTPGIEPGLSFIVVDFENTDVYPDASTRDDPEQCKNSCQQRVLGWLQSIQVDYSRIDPTTHSELQDGLRAMFNRCAQRCDKPPRPPKGKKPIPFRKPNVVPMCPGQGHRQRA